MADGLRQRWLDVPAPSEYLAKPLDVATIIRLIDERLQPKEVL